MLLVYADHHISPFETALTKFFVYADRHISPFEGSPRAGAAEYVQRGGCTQTFRQKKNLVKTFYIQKKVSIFVEKLSN